MSRSAGEIPGGGDDAYLAAAPVVVVGESRDRVPLAEASPFETAWQFVDHEDLRAPDASNSGGEENRRAIDRLFNRLRGKCLVRLVRVNLHKDPEGNSLAEASQWWGEVSRRFKGLVREQIGNTRAVTILIVEEGDLKSTHLPLLRKLQELEGDGLRPGDHRVYLMTRMLEHPHEDQEVLHAVDVWPTWVSRLLQHLAWSASGKNTNKDLSGQGDIGGAGDQGGFFAWRIASLGYEISPESLVAEESEIWRGVTDALSSDDAGQPVFGKLPAPSASEWAGHPNETFEFIAKGGEIDTGDDDLFDQLRIRAHEADRSHGEGVATGLAARARDDAAALPIAHGPGMATSLDQDLEDRRALFTRLVENPLGGGRFPPPEEPPDFRKEGENLALEVQQKQDSASRGEQQTKRALQETGLAHEHFVGWTDRFILAVAAAMALAFSFYAGSWMLGRILGVIPGITGNWWAAAWIPAGAGVLGVVTALAISFLLQRHALRKAQERVRTIISEWERSLRGLWRARSRWLLEWTTSARNWLWRRELRTGSNVRSKRIVESVRAEVKRLREFSRNDRDRVESARALSGAGADLGKLRVVIPVDGFPDYDHEAREELVQGETDIFLKDWKAFSSSWDSDRTGHVPQLAIRSFFDRTEKQTREKLWSFLIERISAAVVRDYEQNLEGRRGLLESFINQVTGKFAHYASANVEQGVQFSDWMYCAGDRWKKWLGKIGEIERKPVVEKHLSPLDFVVVYSEARVDFEEREETQALLIKKRQPA